MPKKKQKQKISTLIEIRSWVSIVGGIVIVWSGYSVMALFPIEGLTYILYGLWIATHGAWIRSFRKDGIYVLVSIGAIVFLVNFYGLTGGFSLWYLLHAAVGAFVVYFFWTLKDSLGK